MVHINQPISSWQHCTPSTISSRNSPAKVHIWSRAEWRILTEISSSGRGPLPHLWLPLSYVVPATRSNNNYLFPTSSWKAMLQIICQGVLSCRPWAWIILEYFSYISAGCEKHITRWRHNKGYTHNIRNCPVSLLVVTRDLCQCSLDYNPLHLMYPLGRTWNLHHSSSIHIKPSSWAYYFQPQIQTRARLLPILALYILP